MQKYLFVRCAPNLRFAKAKKKQNIVPTKIQKKNSPQNSHGKEPGAPLVKMHCDISVKSAQSSYRRPLHEECFLHNPFVGLRQDSLLRRRVLHVCCSNESFAFYISFFLLFSFSCFSSVRSLNLKKRSCSTNLWSGVLAVHLIFYVAVESRTPTTQPIYYNWQPDESSFISGA